MKFYSSGIAKSSIVSLAVLLIVIQAILVVAQPPLPSWPIVWSTPPCNTDPSDESPSQLDLISVDIVGDGYHPAVYYAEDANFLYLRERVEGDPNGPPGKFTQHNWVVLLEQTGDNYYDYLLTLNGKDEYVQIWNNTIKAAAIDWTPIFNDPADTLVWNNSTTTYAKIDSDGLGNWFVSWAIPKNINGFNLNVVRTLYFATSADENNYNKDHLNCYEQPSCGNGTVEPSEQCELPGTINNIYCVQTTQECSGFKLGIRDAYGNCNSICGCTYDVFNNYQCSLACSAECDAQNPCQNTCTDLIWKHSGTCNTSSCLCDGYTSTDCNDGNPCTSDSCDSSTGCSNTIIVGCCLNNSDCSYLNTDCADGVCNAQNECEQQFKPDTTVCRASAGDCDVAESCTGFDASCPNDLKSTAECRASTDLCDVAEVCNGINNDCPPDTVEPYGFVCAIEAGQCEANDICDGVNTFCNEKYAPLSTPCDDGLYCSVTDHCDGNNNCVQLTARDCSGNNIFGISTCNNDPDGNPSTWDSRNPFTSTCNETIDSCTIGDSTINHECDVTNCGAECDQDIDCLQSTSMCDYANRRYCTRDFYGTCNGDCNCVEDQWNCGASDDSAYCSNCIHCGDNTVNCGEDCETGQTGRRCLPIGTSTYYCINKTSYQTPEFDSCKNTCVWDNCTTKIITENDPRCVSLPPPTCSWRNFSLCYPFNKPLISTQIPSFNFQIPTITFSKYNFSSYFIR